MKISKSLFILFVFIKVTKGQISAPFYQHVKVEKTLKGSLDSISSPSASVKIQIMGGKVCLKCKGKTLLGENKKFVDTPQQCFAFTPQANFPAHNLNFH